MSCQGDKEQESQSHTSRPTPELPEVAYLHDAQTDEPLGHLHSRSCKTPTVTVASQVSTLLCLSSPLGLVCDMLHPCLSIKEEPGASEPSLWTQSLGKRPQPQAQVTQIP